MALYEHYVERFDTIRRSLGFGAIELAELVEARGGTAEQRCRDEAGRLREKWQGTGPLIALDARGKAETSEAFASRLQRLRTENYPQLTFVLGGPDGHDPAMLGEASTVLSLGRMTFTHGLARLLLAEQLYRAATILAGHPYHRA